MILFEYEMAKGIYKHVQRQTQKSVRLKHKSSNKNVFCICEYVNQSRNFVKP